MARYQHDYYHQIERENIEQVPGNPWAICTLWHGQWEIANASTMSELRRSLDVLEWAVKRAAPSGVMAEQFDPYTGDPISVSPLTWSHATYVITVLEYLEKHKELCSRTVATAR
ncbi:MAG: glycoside hydrolase family 15 protein, partial [Planctomycetota bacterium]